MYLIASPLFIIESKYVTTSSSKLSTNDCENNPALSIPIGKESTKSDLLKARMGER